MVVCLSACANGQSNEPAKSPSSAQWKSDLNYLATQLPKLHKNSFHTISKEEFQKQVDILSQKIDVLDDDHITTELMLLVALIGDGHTHLDLPSTLERYPFELAQFENDYRVIVTDEQHADILGLRLVAVENLDVDTIHKRLTSLVPRGENLGRTLFTSLQLISSPTILSGLNVVKNKNQALFTFLTDQGQAIKKILQPVAARGDNLRMLPQENIPLMLQNFRMAWWTKFLPEKNAIYFALNAYPNRDRFQENTEQLSRLVDDTKAKKLIIDFRRNQGGDFDLFRTFLLPMLKSKSNLTEARNIYVITGPATFSASMVNTLDLKNELNAIQVGLSTGARPNSYSEHGEFSLPNSHLRVSYSRRYYKFGNEKDTAVVPEKIIKQSWEEFIQGKDPCIEWILR